MFKQKDYEVTITPRYAEGSSVNYLTVRRDYETASGTDFVNSVIDFEKVWAAKLVEFLKDCGVSDASYDETNGRLSFWGFYLVVAVQSSTTLPKSGSAFLPLIIQPKSGAVVSNDPATAYPSRPSSGTAYSSWSSACLAPFSHTAGEPYNLKFGFRFVGEPTKAFALILRGYLYKFYTTSSGSQGNAISGYGNSTRGQTGLSKGYNILSGDKVFYCVAASNATKVNAVTFTGGLPTLSDVFYTSTSSYTLSTSQEVIDANPGVLPLVNKHNETYRWEDGVYYYPAGFGLPKAVATSLDYAVFLRINGRKYWVESGDGVLGLVNAGIVECPTED